MIATPPDVFDEWLRLPVEARSRDPRFEVRRARPEEFERIYEVVDAAFGRKRSRDHYDWIYRRNPCGRARCWIVVERESGAILKTGAGFPWPIWRGRQALKGTLSGDACTVPAFQRRGLAAVRRDFVENHPWHRDFCGIAGPNEGSRIVTQKAGKGDELLGPLRGGTLPLRAAFLLEKALLPAALSQPLGVLADPILRLWRDSALRGGAAEQERIEAVPRFTNDFDEVTERCMAWPKFWSPHNADFLNWRYLDHPVESYVAIASIEADRPMAYAVVCLEREKATLAEFAVEVDATRRRAALLSAAIGVARQAGAASLNFFAPPGWRHWPFFRRVGFLPYRTKNHFEAFGARFEPEALDIRNWQVTPGDRDYR